MKRMLAVALVLLVPIRMGLMPCSAFAQTGSCPVLDISNFFPLEEPVTLTAFAMNVADGTNVGNSYVLQWIREKANVNLEIDYEMCGSEGKTRLGLLMASADRLPDVFLCTRWTKAECALYGAQGYVIPLDEYLKSCVNWNRLTEICGERHVSDLTMPDGNIYCFGSVNECFHCTHQARMWVYQPWIDLLMDGVLPETTEEFYDYLYKVATMDPNGNGLADEIPLTGQIIDGWATDPFTFLSNSFVHNNAILGSTNHTVAAGCYITAGGEVRCNWVEEAYREALRYMNRLYAGGLLDSQTYTQNGEQMNARCEAEPNLVGAAPGGGVPEMNSGLLTGTDGNWQNWTCLPPLEGPEGVRLSYQSNYDYFYNCNGLVSSSCEYPEVAVQMFDLLASTEGTLVQSYGIEGINWAFCEENEGIAMDGRVPLYRYIVPERLHQEGTTDYAAYGYSFVSGSWPPDVQIGSAFSDFRNAILLKEGEFNGEQALWEWAELYDQYSPGLDSVYPNIAFTAEQSKQIAEYTITINSYVAQSTIQFITGSLDIDADWDTYLSILANMDQEGYHALLQAAYDTYREAAK